MILRTLIVEDEPLARRTLREFAAELDWVKIVGEAADGITAVDLIDALEPDLLFLDVRLPEISGVEVMRRVRHRPHVVFTTAYDQYAVSAFELEAADYLLKPFGKARFQAAAERVRRRFAKEDSVGALRASTSTEPLTRLFVRVRGALVPLKVDEISRFEAADDYVEVFTHQQRYLINQTLGELEARLDASRFCRVHRSLIVNLEYVARVESQDRRLLLILKDDTEILASRGGSQSLRKLIF